MAVVKVRNLWTAFITAFFAVLATLGLTTPAAAARAAVAQPADQPADRGAETAVPAPAAPVPAPRVDSGGTVGAPAAGSRRRTSAPAPAALEPRAPRDRSLPPTIKQRITAEAHGSSPSVRRIPAQLPLQDDASGPGASGSDASGRAASGLADVALAGAA
ncbi:DUF6344 domain-containing protein [Streptomyces montanisoli]|uniref:Uncharacterized protein n=1 Tax=Streptomyces montanisoli TaxID=2798581 RepID=A0A940MN92_9ACTN|nr:DUF6344 domain-containing protein [Streptomyces montanisoli]MBP0461508.1 hypothetical protein [Streptomyces montanisoli]